LQKVYMKLVRQPGHSQGWIGYSLPVLVHK
jgi:hypothetical protein